LFGNYFGERLKGFGIKAIFKACRFLRPTKPILPFGVSGMCSMDAAVPKMDALAEKRFRLTLTLCDIHGFTQPAPA